MAYFSTMWTILLLEVFLISYIFCEQETTSPLKFKKILTNFSAVAGEAEIKLTCQVRPSITTQYWWTKDGQNIDTTSRRVRYKPFRYLKIKKVKLSDAGEYSCVASNKAGKIEHKMHLYVAPKPILEIYPAVKLVMEKINNVTAYVGDNVTVLCKAVSDGVPHFQLLVYNKVTKNLTVLHKNQYLLPSEEKRHGVRLFFPNVSLEDAKEYTCMAGNYLGHDYKSFYLNVLSKRPTTETTSPPKFRKILTNFLAVAGEAEIKLTCQVRPSNETRYWWTKDGQNIDTTTRRLRYKPFRYLKIKKVKLSDAGEYTCVARNKAGQIEHKMHLYVAPKPIQDIF